MPSSAWPQPDRLLRPLASSSHDAVYITLLWTHISTMRVTDDELTQILARPGYQVVPPSPRAPAQTPEPVIGPLSSGTTERVLLTRIRRLAKEHGWRCYHTYDSRHSEEGYPDLTLARQGRLIFAELKSQKGRLTGAQVIWSHLLRSTVPGIEVYVWRPQDWPTIVTILTRKETHGA